MRVPKLIFSHAPLISSCTVFSPRRLVFCGAETDDDGNDDDSIFSDFSVINQSVTMYLFSKRSVSEMKGLRKRILDQQTSVYQK